MNKKKVLKQKIEKIMKQKKFDIVKSNPEILIQDRNIQRLIPKEKKRKEWVLKYIKKHKKKKNNEGKQ